MLREEPYIFDNQEADFAGVAAIHALAAKEEGFELRPVPGDEDEGEDKLRAEAARWLQGVEGMTAERASEALSAARNNGFCTTFPGGPESEPMLLFRRMCIFNHSCAPNCCGFRDESGVSQVLAIREVEEGAELLIHYSEELILLPSDLRRSFLRGRFGFDCQCVRCEKKDEVGAMVDVFLNKTAEGRAVGGQEESQLLHAMRMAHSSLCTMQKQGGKPAGFGFRNFDSLPEALAAVDAAMPAISAYGATTFWARHHVRGLRCQVLEELGRDAATFLALAEHADASWRLLPRYCDGLKNIWERFQQVKDRLPSALRPRFEQSAATQFGEGLRGLEIDVTQLQAWLREAAAVGRGPVSGDDMVKVAA
ncbi:unnamed protein product [Polarella glacialis]|uniref:SET domain-containing protein n=1 Tax=Polarella glacialis TaxID=89957 RepID=A0A813GTM1_POLGL|nr:unnamed protein product [Polarella glacialis]